MIGEERAAAELVRLMGLDPATGVPAVSRAKEAVALVSLTPLYTKASLNVRKKADEKSALLGRLGFAPADR